MADYGDIYSGEHEAYIHVYMSDYMKILDIRDGGLCQLNQRPTGPCSLLRHFAHIAQHCIYVCAYNLQTGSAAF